MKTPTWKNIILGFLLSLIVPACHVIDMDSRLRKVEAAMQEMPSGDSLIYGDTLVTARGDTIIHLELLIKK